MIDASIRTALQDKKDWKVTSSTQRASLVNELTVLLNCKVPLDGLLSVMFGFKVIDIEALDKRIGTPNGVSMTDHLIQKYGKRANEIVDLLIH